MDFFFLHLRQEMPCFTEQCTHAQVSDVSSQTEIEMERQRLLFLTLSLSMFPCSLESAKGEMDEQDAGSDCMLLYFLHPSKRAAFQEGEEED